MMEVTDTKKIKVKITDEAGTYTTDGHRYLPGDIVQIDPSDFCDWFMEKVDAKPVKPKEAIIPITHEVAEETIATTAEVKEKLVEEVKEEPKKRRRRS